MLISFETLTVTFAEISLMEVTLHNISFGYSDDKMVFDGFNAHFESKKTHILLGKSGCGKTTLLKIIAGELLPDSGHIESSGTEWKQPENSPIHGFKHVALLNQEFDLLPYNSVKENIRRKLHGYSPDEEEEIIREVSHTLDISDILHRKASLISGGQRQRVAFAAALAARPQVLLLDEPMSNQDFKNAENIKDIIHWLRGNKTLIIATHEGSEALSQGDSISIMHEGKILQKGTPQDVYNSPKNEYCAELLGHYNLVPIHWLSKYFDFNPTTSDEHLILRPNDFMLTKTHGLPCNVRRVEYHGMYHLILVSADDLLLYVYYSGRTFEPWERWKVALTL